MVKTSNKPGEPRLSFFIPTVGPIISLLLVCIEYFFVCKSLDIIDFCCIIYIP